MKNGPNEALLHLNESIRKQTVKEYTKWEINRVKDTNYDQPLDFSQSVKEKILSLEDEELKNVLMRTLGEQDTIRKAYLNRSNLMRNLNGKSSEEIIRLIRTNTYKRRLTDISVSFVKDHVHQVTTINPGGQMVTFSFTEEAGVSITENPEWLNNFDLYRNKRAVTLGRNSSYHEDNDRRRNSSGKSNNGKNNNYHNNRRGSNRNAPYSHGRREERNFERDDRDDDNNEDARSYRSERFNQY